LAYETPRPGRPPEILAEPATNATGCEAASVPSLRRGSGAAILFVFLLTRPEAAELPEASLQGGRKTLESKSFSR